MEDRSGSFVTWFDSVYRRDGETRAAAIARFQTESGLGFSTIYYALRGVRVSATSASRIEDFTAGVVGASTLIRGPSRAELLGTKSGAA